MNRVVKKENLNLLNNYKKYNKIYYLYFLAFFPPNNFISPLFFECNTKGTSSEESSISISIYLEPCSIANLIPFIVLEGVNPLLCPKIKLIF